MADAASLPGFSGQLSRRRVPQREDRSRAALGNRGIEVRATAVERGEFPRRAVEPVVAWPAAKTVGQGELGAIVAHPPERAFEEGAGGRVGNERNALALFVLAGCLGDDHQ